MTELGVEVGQSPELKLRSIGVAQAQDRNWVGSVGTVGLGSKIMTRSGVNSGSRLT